MLGEVVAVDARLVVVAVDVGVGDDAAQVLVAGPVPREQDEVERLGVLAPLPVGHRAAGDVRLDPDDGLDAVLLARLVERHGPVEGPVIGDGERVEALAWRPLAVRSSMRPRPSSRLNSEWTWRWVKSFGAIVIGGPMVARRSRPGPGRRSVGRSAGRARRVGWPSAVPGRPGVGPRRVSLAPRVGPYPSESRRCITVGVPRACQPGAPGVRGLAPGLPVSVVFGTSHRVCPASG